MKHILITSISSKVPLIKTIIESKNRYDQSIKLFGADLNDNVIGRYFVDIFWKMERLETINIDKIVNYCLENKIKYIIPTRDEDVVFFSKHYHKLMENGIFSFVSSYDSVAFCFDKLNFYEKSKFPEVIETKTDINSIHSSTFVVKERFGSGSNNIRLNCSKSEAIEFAKKLKYPIFQPFFNGQEFSVDSFVTKNNKVVDSIIRSRDIVIDGESKVTTVVKDKKLKKLVKNFLTKHKIRGHSVLQVIKDNESYHIVECNARFGGASTLSYKMGLDSFYWFLLESNDKPIKYKRSKKNLKQIRVQQDLYFES